MQIGDLYLMEQSSAYPLAKCWCMVLAPSKSGGWLGTLVKPIWSDDPYTGSFTVEQDHPGAVLVGRNVRNVKPRPAVIHNLTRSS